MRDEDLTPFFNTDEHAVEATMQTPQGVLVATANVIFSTPVGELQVGAGEVAHLQPTFQAPTAELTGVKKDYIVRIWNEAESVEETYRVVRRENDGTGLSTVWLRKQ
jgi:hypothetical protein